MSLDDLERSIDRLEFLASSKSRQARPKAASSKAPSSKKKIRKEKDFDKQVKNYLKSNNAPFTVFYDPMYGKIWGYADPGSHDYRELDHEDFARFDIKNNSHREKHQADYECTYDKKKKTYNIHIRNNCQKIFSDHKDKLGDPEEILEYLKEKMDCSEHHK